MGCGSSKNKIHNNKILDNKIHNDYIVSSLFVDNIKMNLLKTVGYETYDQYVYKIYKKNIDPKSIKIKLTDNSVSVRGVIDNKTILDDIDNSFRKIERTIIMPSNTNIRTLKCKKHNDHILITVDKSYPCDPDVEIISIKKFEYKKEQNINLNEMYFKLRSFYETSNSFYYIFNINNVKNITVERNRNILNIDGVIYKNNTNENISKYLIYGNITHSFEIPKDTYKSCIIAKKDENILEIRITKNILG